MTLRRLLALWLLLCMGTYALAQSIPLTGAGGKFKAAGGGGGGGGATFDPATLSGQSLDATHLITTATSTTAAGINGAETSVRHTASGGDKVVCEFTIGTDAGSESIGVGFGNAHYFPGDSAGGGGGRWLGGGNNSGFPTSSMGYYDDGIIYMNSSAVTTVAGFTTGDVISMELDNSSGVNTIQFFKNGTSVYGPTAHGVTSGDYAAAATANTINDSVTLNCGQNAWTHTPTSGFVGW